jgi:large repetitive protein
VRSNRWWAVVLAAVCSTLVVVPPGLASPAMAQITGDLSASKAAPAQVLAGEPISYTLTAENDGATPFYNLTFRDVLPVGVSYIPGSTAPSAAGEPRVVENDVPDTNPGALPTDTIVQQTLIWSNVADLQATDEFSLSFDVDVNSTGDPARNDVHVIGATIVNSGEAYGGTDPRRLPTFDSEGALVPGANDNVVVAPTSPASTTLTAVEITKESTGAPEGELLRGVHDQVVTYSLTIEATDLGSTDLITVTDLLPAQLEFLGCGGVDNGTSGPEFPGAPLLSATPVLDACVAPSVVETVQNPVLGDVTYSGVYTRVVWTLPSVSSTTPIVLRYQAGVPLFANAPFPSGNVPSTTGAQGSNLDNNTGPSTREPAGSENSITNVARVEGDFSEAGLLEPGVGNPVADQDTLTRTIEDIRIRKRIVFPDEFRSGSEAEYSIIVETSEYMNATNVVLTDLVPNGMCPLGNVTSTPVPTDSVCSQNRGPTPLFESVELIDGTGGYEVVFQPIAEIPANGEFEARYRTFMRGSYEGGDLDGLRTVSGDAFTNTVASRGVTTGIDEIRFPSFPAEVGDPLPDVVDGSSATLDTTSLSLDKRLLPRNMSPRLSAIVPAGQRCPDRNTDPLATTDQYLEADAPPGPGDVDSLGFRVGDQICFRLRVDFDSNVATRDAELTDFLPLGTTYVDGSLRETVPAPGEVRPPFTVTTSADGPLTFTIGNAPPTQDDDGVYVNLDAVFEVVFAVEVTQVPPIDTAVLAGNLMKLRTENSRGQAQSYREQANFAIVPAPPIGVVKGIASVDGVPIVPNAANSNVDGLVVQQGSAVTFRIDLTNLGVPENLTDYSARELEVLDLLPAAVDCGDISNISNFGPATGLGVCLNPGQSSGGFTNDIPGDVSVIRWALGGTDDYALFPADATSPPAPTGTLGTRSLTYTMTIPTPTSVSTRLDNVAGVRTYGGFTNLQDAASASYVPQDNIDPSLSASANAPAADDFSWVETPTPTVEKFVTSWIGETGNNFRSGSPAPTAALPVVGERAQAVIGEYVTFRYLVDIPAQTTVFGAQLVDQLSVPSNFVFDTSPPTPVPAPSLTFYPDASSSVAGPALPTGVTFTPASGAVNFGATYTNDTETDQRFEVVISARVVAGTLNATTQPSRQNTARFASNDVVGTPLEAIEDTAFVDIRQPQPFVTKTASSSSVIGNDVVTYTLTARAGGSRPPLHDAWLEDCVPFGLEDVAIVGTPGSTIGPLTGAAAVTAGCAADETYVAFGLGTLRPGAAAVARQYTRASRSTRSADRSTTTPSSSPEVPRQRKPHPW